MAVQRVGIMTGGGDCPGLNAAIRAVVRSGIDKGWEMFGVRSGYAGLLAGDWISLSAREVGGNAETREPGDQRASQCARRPERRCQHRGRRDRAALGDVHGDVVFEY